MEKLKYSFQENGFVLLKNIIPEEKLVSYRDLTDRIIRYSEKGLIDPFEGYYMHHRTDQGALYDLFQRHPEFRSLAQNETVLEFLSEIMGDDIFLYENSLVYKPKGKRNEVPWHQDFINRSNEPVKLIAWFALDKVKIENGALKVIPGSHKNGFLPCYTKKGETHHTRVKPEFVDESKAEFVELDAGDVMIFNQLLLHGSDRVNVVSPRRAFRVSYQNFDQISTPRATPIVLKGGTPESLASKFADKKKTNKKSIKEKIIRSIVYRLEKIIE